LYEEEYKPVVEYYGKNIPTIEICETAIKFAEHYCCNNAAIQKIGTEYFRISETQYLNNNIIPKYSRNKKINQYIKLQFPIFKYYVKNKTLIFPENCTIVTLGYYEKYGLNWCTAYCAKYNNIIILKYLHNTGKNLNIDSALICATHSDHIKIVKYLHKNDINIITRNNCAVAIAIKYGSYKVLKYLHVNGGKLTAYNNKPVCLDFINTNIKNVLKVIQYLHKNGIDLKARNNHLLKWACDNCYIPIVKYLIENGVDINAENNYAICWSNRYAKENSTRNLYQNNKPVTSRKIEEAREACEIEQLELIKYLHENGANIVANDNGPITFAGKLGNTKVLKYLHEHGADITARDNCVKRFAVFTKNTELLEYLKSLL
jgi:ankyrin repeat protein